MNESYIRNVIEAALLAAGKPLQLAELGQLFDETARPKVDDLRAALDALAAEYSNRGVEVKETAAGFRIQVRREFSTEVSRLWPERPARYSRALLETLALVAYRQPITRAEIEAVRGVAVNPNIVKTLIERNWVRVVGHRDVPGRPELLGTTREFLDYFGLRTLDELPPLAEVKALGEYHPQLELTNAVAVLGGGAEATPVAQIAHDGEAAVTHDGVTAQGDDVATAAEPHVEGEAAVADAMEEGPEAVLAAEDLAGDAAVVEHDAVDVVSVDAERHTAADAVATEHENAEHHASSPDTDAEADRTLSAGEGAEAEESNASSESLESAEDAADDDADEDELSADGHGSHELVAAPPDLES